MSPTAALKVPGSTWPLFVGFFWVSFVLSSAKEDVEVDASIILTALHPPEHQLTDLEL